MQSNTHDFNIKHGMDVIGADGDKIGEVSGIEGEYIIVVKGFFFPSDHYIPFNAISDVDEKVYLNVTKDAALNQGWDTVPDTTTTAAYGTTQATTSPGGLATDPGYVDASVDDTVLRQETVSDDADATDTMRVELAEEELSAKTRSVDRGAVHVEKITTEEQQTLDVPVTEERATISRRVVDRDVAPGDAAFEEGTIDVPLRGEEVEVEKRARVREEIEIGKEQVTTSEQVTDTVRREKAQITDDTETVVEDTSDVDRPRRS